MNTPANKKAENLTLGDLVNKEEIVERAVDILIHGTADNLREEVRKSVAAQLGKLVEQITEEEVRRIVLNEIKDGWPEYTRWGSTTKRVTLAESVTTMLEHQADWEGYGRGRSTWLEHTMRKILSNVVEKDLKEEAQAARVKFAAMVDEVIKSKFAETIRNALGGKS